MIVLLSVGLLTWRCEDVLSTSVDDCVDVFSSVSGLGRDLYAAQLTPDENLARRPERVKPRSLGRE